jgi:phospholipase C
MRFHYASPLLAVLLGACGSSSSGGSPPAGDAGGGDAIATDSGGGGDGGDGGGGFACSGPCPQSKVKYLVVIIQENHTFDNHFGQYCTAPTGTIPSCNTGPACCEAGPDKEPGGASPLKLDDTETINYDNNHSQQCELDETDNGKMDHYVTGATCSSVHTFAYADQTIIKPYWDLAKTGALADRYFQPIAGQSVSNNMYFARAQFVFKDNLVDPKGAVGQTCELNPHPGEYTDTTIGDLLNTKGVPWAFYAEGYKSMQDSQASGTCPGAPADCTDAVRFYPCNFDPGDNPFEYYPALRDKPEHMKDFTALAQDLANGTLPAVTFLKAAGYRSEHPGSSIKLSDGVNWASGVIQQILQSQYKNDVLVVLTYDEGGGYFDHVAPPGMGSDNQPYGTRIPFLALGPFAKVNFISHQQMEHSSLVKFVEWNWLSATGQLNGRDANVANIGSVLDSTKTGVAVPEN